MLGGGCLPATGRRLDGFSHRDSHGALLGELPPDHHLELLLFLVLAPSPSLGGDWMGEALSLDCLVFILVNPKQEPLLHQESQLLIQAETGYIGRECAFTPAVPILLSVFACSIYAHRS